MSAVDVLAVMQKACRNCPGPAFRDLEAATEAVAKLMDFAQSFVLNGRQKYNATPELVALSDAAEAVLARCGK